MATTTTGANEKHSVKTVKGVRILLVAEVRGELSKLNRLAEQEKADCIVHTGNFGFFDEESARRISSRTLRHIASFSPLVDPSALPADNADLKRTLGATGLSELPSFLSGKSKLNVPVYTIYGASEDLAVVEKFRNGTYSVPNLHIVDETTTHGIDTGSGVNVRVMGLGGNLLLHRFFDNGDGASTIAGTYGLMWTTALQMGQLIQTVHKNFSPQEVRLFVCHPCPSREGLLAQLALSLRADFTVSSGLHFIYGSSFNEFTTGPTFDYFRGKLAAARAAFMDVWDTVRDQVMPLVEGEPKQKQLLQNCLEVIERMPTSSTGGGSSSANEYLLTAFRSMWNFNLCDSQYGTTLLNIVDGKFSVESKSEGFDFSFRKKSSVASSATASSTASPRPDEATPKSATEELVNVNGGESSTATTTTTTKPQGPPPPPRDAPGVWVANGHVPEAELREFFAEEDREKITRVVIKEAYQHPEKKFALVYFSSAEEATKAIERVDNDKAGRVSLISPPHYHSHRGGSRGGTGRGGFHRGGGPSSFRGRGGARGGGRPSGSYRNNTTNNTTASTTTPSNNNNNTASPSNSNANPSTGNNSSNPTPTSKPE